MSITNYKLNRIVEHADERGTTTFQDVVTVAEAAGKAAGILLYDPATIARHRERGFRFIGLGADSAFVANGARAILATAQAG